MKATLSMLILGLSFAGCSKQGGQAFDSTASSSTNTTSSSSSQYSAPAPNPPPTPATAPIRPSDTASRLDTTRRY